MPATGNTTAQQFYHGIRADLKPGDLIAVGYNSNCGTAKPLSWVYLTGTLDAAIWGAELAAGNGRERIHIVEPTGPIFDDPNLTDQKFPAIQRGPTATASLSKSWARSRSGNATHPNG